MFEANEDPASFTSISNASLSSQIYTRNSTSSTDNVPEGLMGNFSFAGTDDSLYYNSSNNSLPKNPHDPESTFNADFLEEDLGLDSANSTNELISSLMSDPGRNPFELIQEDFPSTPSNIYSSRLLSATDGIFNADVNASNATSSRLKSGISSSSLQHSLDTSLDHATLSMQNLYVSEEEHRSARVQSPDMMSHAHLSNSSIVATSPGNSTALGLRRSPAPTNPPFALSDGMNVASSASPLVISPSNATNVSHPLSIGSSPTSASQGNATISSTSVNTANNLLVPDYITQVISQTPSSNHSQNIQVQFGTLEPMTGMQSAIQSSISSSSQQLQPQQQPQLMAHHHQQAIVQQQQIAAQQAMAAQAAAQGYFLHQPAIYIDQNGQPVYYRVAQPQFQPEMIYPDGLPADHMQAPFIPLQMPGFWPPGSQDPNQPMSGQIFVPGQPVDGSNVVNRPLNYPPPFGSSTNTNQNVTQANGRVVIPAGGPIIPGNNMYGLQMSPGQIPMMPHQAHMMAIPQRGLTDSGVEYHMMQGNIRDEFHHPNIGGPNHNEYRSPDGRSYSMNHSLNYGRGGGYDDDRNDIREYNRGGNDRGHRFDHRNGGSNDRSGGNRTKSNFRSPTNEMPNNASRDSLVEEFRNTFGRKQWTLRSLAGHVAAFCQDQHGSRFIQQQLELCSETEKQLTFDEITPQANQLMTDVFGNYVLQKMFEFGSSEQCDALSSLLIGQCVALSLQMYGCRVVQKALEYVAIPRLVALVREFENPQILLDCVHDANGNHVIQKCIEVVSKASKEAKDPETQEYLTTRIQFIIDAFQTKVKELSSHPYGCRVVQRILEHCSNSQKAVILEELRQCCSELVQDCYGNYVIQFVMQHGWEADRAILIKEVHANLLDYSQHKFASNVVEKCLQHASRRDRDEMIWKIINVTFDPNSPVDGKGNSALETMVRDPYANYVVQKVIDVSDEKQRGAIVRYVKDNINQLRRYTYGKHIIMRLEKITNEKF